METLKQLVDAGILYEDQFIEMYFKLLRDEGFMSFFGIKEEDARKLLTVLIDESKGHKADLEQLKQSMI